MFLRKFNWSVSQFVSQVGNGVKHCFGDEPIAICCDANMTKEAVEVSDQAESRLEIFVLIKKYMEFYCLLCIYGPVFKSCNIC